MPFNREKFQELVRKVFSRSDGENIQKIQDQIVNLLEEAVKDLQGSPDDDLIRFFIDPAVMDRKDNKGAPLIYITWLPKILRARGVQAVATIAHIGKVQGVINDFLIDSIRESITSSWLLNGEAEKSEAIQILFDGPNKDTQRSEQKRDWLVGDEKSVPPPRHRPFSLSASGDFSNNGAFSEIKRPSAESIEQCFAKLVTLCEAHQNGRGDERAILRAIQALPDLGKACIAEFLKERKGTLTLEINNAPKSSTVLYYLLRYCTDLDILKEIQELIEVWKQKGMWDDDKNKDVMQSILSNQSDDFKRGTVLLQKILFERSSLDSTFTNSEGVQLKLARLGGANVPVPRVSPAKPQSSASPVVVPPPAQSTNAPQGNTAFGALKPKNARSAQPFNWRTRFQKYWPRYLGFAVATAFMLILCFFPPFAAAILPAVLVSATQWVMAGVLPTLAGVAVSMVVGMAVAGFDYVFAVAVWCGAMALKGLCLLGWAFASLTDIAWNALKYAKNNIKTHTGYAVGAGFLGLIGFAVMALPTLIVAGIVELGETLRSLPWLHGKIKDIRGGDSHLKPKHDYFWDARKAEGWKALVDREFEYMIELNPTTFAFDENPGRSFSATP